ncbi:MAG TPA: hypothetical protein EYN79_10365 [Planctomycetes bacterium]|nr:hypothetical protein [Planctomycetota bacterium]HIN80455.1 hypothetical protein [Planctomycetota bacterium]
MNSGAEVQAEDRAFFSGCALLPGASGATSIEVAGCDAEDYLQRMLSCDLRQVTSSCGCRGTLMTAKGKLVSFFDIHRLADRFLLICDGDSHALSEGLKRLIILEEVEVSPSSLSLLSIQGPKSEEFLGAALAESGWQLELPAKFLQLASLPLAEAPTGVVVRRPRSLAGGWDIHASMDEVSRIQKALEGRGAVVSGEGAAERARICLGLPRFGHEATDRRMPPECALDDAISYDKGCYAGQEVMARIRTYGHVNRLLRQVQIEGDSVPSVGDEVHLAVETARKKIGLVTSSTLDLASGEGRALASVAYKSADPGTEVLLISEDKTISGVLALPFTP